LHIFAKRLEGLALFLAIKQDGQDSSAGLAQPLGIVFRMSSKFRFIVYKITGAPEGTPALGFPVFLG